MQCVLLRHVVCPAFCCLSCTTTIERLTTLAAQYDISTIYRSYIGHMMLDNYNHLANGYVFIAIFLLLSPGFIAIRILWRNKKISQGDYFFIVCDYAVYSFLIHMMTYGVMFFTYPERTVSFSASLPAASSIITADFVFKFSAVSLFFALAMPAFVPWVVRIWRSLEDGRKKK